MTIVQILFMLIAFVGDTGNRETIQVGVKDKGTTVNIHKGDVLEVVLPSSLGTGFSWHLSGDAHPCLFERGKPETKVLENNKPTTGGGEYQVFRFEGREVGTCRLQLEYKRPWDTTRPPSHSYTLVVKVR